MGRFINADAYASTGQGVLGNNMFAYCLNNPVVLTDSSGTAAHIGFSADGQIHDAPWRIGSPGGGGWSQDIHYSQQDYGAVADKFYTVRAAQFVGNRIAHSANKLWDSYVYSVERKAELEYQQVVTVRAFCEDVVRSPARTGDFVAMTFSNVSTFASYVGFCAAPTLGAGIWLIGNFGVCVWTTLRYFNVISE